VIGDCKVGSGMEQYEVDGKMQYGQARKRFCETLLYCCHCMRSDTDCNE
jgi:hypothetical protein